MSKTKTMYQVREFVGSRYSRELGFKLRDRSHALRVAKILKNRGRSVYIAAVKVAA